MKLFKNLEIQQNYDLSVQSGIRVGGQATYFYELTDLSELSTLVAFAKESKVKIVPIGSGTNSFYGTGKLNILGIKNNLMDTKITSEDDDSVIVEVASGENWDDFVQYTVKNGYSGIEALSAIPGTVGAAPVQNIGAYGQEVSNVIQSVSVFDIKSDTRKTLTPGQCEFSYRNSIFKQNPGRYFITAVTFKLGKVEHPGVPDYKVAQDYFAEQRNDDPTLQEISDGIAEIRWSKLPDPEVLPNCGSWFKNPIIPILEFYKLVESFPKLNGVFKWEVGKNDDGESFKLSAGWLVDQAVGRDFCNKYFCTYPKTALVIVNPSITASPKKLLKFESLIVNAVQDKFGITLEREPILVN